MTREVRPCPAAWAEWAAWACNSGRKPDRQEGCRQDKQGRLLVNHSKPLFLSHNNACQLEGSDHGGRDSAAELALAGTNDVQVPDSSYNRLDFGANPIRREKLCSPDSESVNEFLDGTTGGQPVCCQLPACNAAIVEISCVV
jgi:hypothetical protein